MIKLSNDIYDITKTVTELQKEYIEESAETLAVGIYGYLADSQSLQIQNSIILGSELGNELFPARAKFERNIISHALWQNITDINATPSTINILLEIKKSTLDNLFILDQFKIDRDCPIYIENFEFHLEYDLIITRSFVSNKECIYSARYDVSVPNKISDITNPYLTTPFIQINNTEPYICILCRLMQVQHYTVYRKLLTNNAIENKTFDFDIDNQLANFDVKITEGDQITYLEPIFEGVGIDNNITKYCFYTFINTNTIRVRFDSISYSPGINASIEINIRTTKGDSGNFEYNMPFYTSINSDKYNYKNLDIIVVPSSNAEGGKDKKPIDQLRRQLPKEALSRGSITNMQDLRNYFSMFNDTENILLPKKRVDNQFERSYYAYLLLKDQYNNVIPTNTLDLEVSLDQFDSHDNRKYVLKQGCCIYYDGKYGTIRNINDNDIQEMLLDDRKQYIYTIPFMMVITADPLYVSYYLSLVQYASYLNFTYINPNTILQFISTNIGWWRTYVSEPDTYTMKMSIQQNIGSDQELLKFDDNGGIIEENIKVIAVLYNSDSDLPYRYLYGNLDYYDLTENRFDYKFKLITDDKINDDNKIKINNVYVPGLDRESIDYGYFSGHIKVDIYVLAKLKDGENHGLHDLGKIVPEDVLMDYTVCNMYSVVNGLDFYINYSQIINSAVEDIRIKREYDIVSGFHINSVPVIRYNYTMAEDQMNYLIDQLILKKAYLDSALYLIENNFLIDFKFFNTYGPSRIYSLDKDGNKIIDRTHLTLNFELKLLQNSDLKTKEYIIKDLKDIIENLNNLASLHIPNIITTVTNSYRNSIEYFEFLGFNDYGPGVQHLYRHEDENTTMVPEFLNIYTLNDLTPDINIVLA